MNLTTGIPDGLRRAQPAAIADLPRLSHFVARALDREAGTDRSEEHRLALLRELSERPWTAERMQAELAQDLPAGAGADELAAALRRLRRRVLLGLISRDVTGIAELAEVMRTTTALAELALGSALSLHARELALAHGVPHGGD